MIASFVPSAFWSTGCARRTVNVISKQFGSDHRPADAARSVSIATRPMKRFEVGSHVPSVAVHSPVVPPPVTSQES